MSPDTNRWESVHRVAEHVMWKGVAMGEMERSSRADIESAVRVAFAGVRLGNGMSLTMAEALDDWVDPSIVDGLRGTEPDDDWTAIGAAELERADAVAHLDAEGLRYYLPALMLLLLHRYEPTEMWCIGTTAALDQRERHPDGFMELLSPAQRRAIALYVRALPALVPLVHDHAAILDRSFRAVWSRELGADS